MGSERALLCAIALAACKSGASAPDGTARTDATATADASAVDASTVDASTVDAVVPDGAPDATDLARVDLRVLTNTGDGMPLQNAIAIFMDPSGAVVKEGVVDLNGNAHASLPSGGAVTVLHLFIDSGNGGTHEVSLTTIEGVKPGDRLLVGRPLSPAYLGGTTDTMTATYTAPTGDDPNLVRMITPCGVSNQHLPLDGAETLTFYDTCRTSSFDMLTVAQDHMGGRQFVWQPGLTEAPNSTVAVPDAWQSMVKSTTTVQNVPANLQRVAATQSALVGLAQWQLDAEANELPTAGTQTLGLFYLPSASDGTLLRVFTVQGIAILEQYVVVTHASPAALTVDLGTLAVPSMTHAKESANGATWTQVDRGTPDARFLVWGGSWQDANMVNHSVNWLVMEPASSVTMTTLRALPSDWSAEDPTIAAGLTLGNATVSYIDYDNLDGYDAARPLGPVIMDAQNMMLDVDHRVHSSASP